MESLSRQTATSFQILIAINNATAEVEDWFTAQWSMDSRVKISNFGNIPGQVALGLAVSQVESEFIARLDSDDVAMPERLSLQIEFLDKNRTSVAVGSYIDLIDASGLVLKAGSQYPRLIKKGSLIINSPIAHPASMFRRESYLLAGGYDTRASDGVEDFDLWQRMLTFGSISNIPEALTQYRQHDDQLSFAHRDSQLRGRMASLSRALSGPELTNSASFESQLKSFLRGLGTTLRLKIAFSYVTETRWSRVKKIKFLAGLIFK